MEKKKINLGKIIGPHGTRGLFKVEFYNQDCLDLEIYKNKIFLGYSKISLDRKFKKGKLTICKSENFKSREELEKVVGKILWINESDLQKTKNSEYFHKDLIGCSVYSCKRECLGKVIAIHNFGAGDLLELNNNYKYMIRFYDLNESGIDIKNKIIQLSKNYEISE